MHAIDRIFAFEIMSRQGKVDPERTIKSFCSALKDCAAGFGTVKALWKQNVGDCVYSRSSCYQENTRTLKRANARHNKICNTRSQIATTK